MKVLFCQVPVGASFEFRGQRYKKLALSMAEDERRWGCVFQDAAEVTVDDGLALVTPRYDPYWMDHWADRIYPAPGQREKG